MQRFLESFGVPATVIRIDRAPAFERYVIQMDTGMSVRKIYTLRHDLEYAFGDVRIETLGNKEIGIEVPTERTFVNLKDVMSYEPYEVTFGESIRGIERLALSDITHLLVFGATGSGKSVFVNSVISELVIKHDSSQLELMLTDFKQVELDSWSGLPHVIGYATDNTSVEFAVNKLFKKMQDRFTEMRKAKVRHADNIGLPRVVAVFDEMADVAMSTAGTETMRTIERLAQLARAAGITLVMSMQRPDAKIMGGALRNNIPTRLGFRVPKRADSQVGLDSPDAARLLGSGYGLLRTAEGMVRLQSPFIDDTSINKIVSVYNGKPVRRDIDISVEKEKPITVNVNVSIDDTIGESCADHDSA